jgi:hypothetical protein
MRKTNATLKSLVTIVAGIFSVPVLSAPSLTLHCTYEIKIYPQRSAEKQSPFIDAGEMTVTFDLEERRYFLIGSNDWHPLADVGDAAIVIRDEHPMKDVSEKEFIRRNNGAYFYLYKDDNRGNWEERSGSCEKVPLQIPPPKKPNLF